jgi:hypothetical protein
MEGDISAAQDKTTMTTAPMADDCTRMPMLRRIHNDVTAVKKKGASKISQQPVKEKDAVKEKDGSTNTAPS